MSLNTTSFLFGHFREPLTNSSFDLITGVPTNQSEAKWNSTTASSTCSLLQYEDYIPWNNPRNIVSHEVEDITRQVKDLLFLPIMFLFGCPANLINMAVFYKQGLKERINVCLFALSLSDELYMVNNMLWFGEQMHIVFTTKEIYGPVLRFMVNNRLIVFHGFIWVSQILTAIIASERCFCILQPLRSQTVLQTSTMTAIIVVVNVVIVGVFYLVVTRYYIICAHDPITGQDLWTASPGEFFLRHRDLIVYLDVFVYGTSLPGLVMVVVIATTAITAIKLRQAAAWRAGTSSSTGLSQRDIALTKMLVANSVFFVACVFPFAVLRFVFFSMPEVNNGGRQHNFYMMIQWLLIIVSYFNCSFNIIVYYSMGSRYRETFWQLFGRSQKKDQPRNSLNS